MDWQEWVNDNPLPWLLEVDEANPGVRYRALRELMGRPGDDPEVREAQQAVMRQGPVPAILDAQFPQGYWVKPGGGYSPKYRSSVWQVMFLAELGADPTDERVRRGCESVLANSVASSGAFSTSQVPEPSGAIHCLNGNLIWALQRLGYGEEPQVEEALMWLSRSIVGDPSIRYYRRGTRGPGFACSVNGGLPCAWGAAKAIRALLEVPAQRRQSPIHQAIQAGVELLLSRDPALADYPPSQRVSPTWFKLGFPLSYWSDVLEVASVLAQAGLGADPRLDRAWDWILAKQDDQGRWRLENSLNGKMWADIEVRGRPSKWVTLRALIAFQQRASSQTANRRSQIADRKSQIANHKSQIT